MRYSPRSVLLAIAYLTTSTQALPRPATYSVVNVDGGQTQYAPPTTIIQTVTESTDSETTISVTVPTTPTTTVIVDDPTTIVSTNYQTVPGRATETALVPEVSAPPHHPENSPPTTTNFEQPTHYMPIPESTPTSTPKAEVVTVVSVTTATPSTTTSYYDNGMWHTSYAIRPTTSTLPAQYSTSSSTSAYTSWGTTGTSGVAMPTGSYSASGWNSTTRYW